MAIFNFALDSWDEKPSLPKAVVPGRKNLEYLLRKQYVYGYMVFFNLNICRNNTQDVRQITEFAHDNRVATDYHINETPMLEQDEHFKHLSDNPTYIRPEDWREIDSLVDWLIEKNKAGYQMVNSVQRLQEIKAFIRMSPDVDLKRLGWNGDGTGTNGDIAKQTCRTCPASCRTPMVSCTSPNGTAAPARTTSSSAPTAPWLLASPCMPPPTTGETLIGHKFDSEQLAGMKTDLPAALLLHAESQPRLLLQRRTGDQVCVDQLGEASDEGWSEEFRGLKQSTSVRAELSPRVAMFSISHKIHSTMQILHYEGMLPSGSPVCWNHWRVRSNRWANQPRE